MAHDINDVAAFVGELYEAGVPAGEDVFARCAERFPGLTYETLREALERRKFQIPSDREMREVLDEIGAPDGEVLP